MQILEAYDLTGSLRSAASLEGTRDMSDALKGRNSDLVLDPRIRSERRRRASDSKEAQEASVRHIVERSFDPYSSLCTDRRGRLICES
jgi:hypothetical protein